MLLSRLCRSRSRNSTLGHPSSAAAMDVRASSSSSSAMASLVSRNTSAAFLPVSRNASAAFVEIDPQVLQRPVLKLLDGTFRAAEGYCDLVNVFSIAEAHLHHATLVRR